MKIIGIDPDLHKSGIAVYETETKAIIKCQSLFMWDLLKEIRKLHGEAVMSKKQVFVRLEYPQNTNTYHAGGKGAAINVGKNQAVAIIISEFLEKNEIPFEKLYPAGYSKTFKDEKYFKMVTKFESKTNQDSRAAAAMCFGYVPKKHYL